MVFGNKFNTYIRDVCDIIYSAVMFSFVFETKLMEHFHHSMYPSFWSDCFDEIVFDVYVFLEVAFQLQAFCSGLQSQTCANIPITTSYKTEVTFFQELFTLQPLIKVDQSFLNRYTFIDLILCNSSEFSTKFSELWVKSRPDILMKRVQFFILMSINQNNRKLNDLRARIYFIIFDTSSLKIKYKQVLHLRLIILGWQVKFDLIDFFFGVSGFIFVSKFNTNIAYIRHVIDTTMMSAFMLYVQQLKHVHHSSYLLNTQHFCTVFFDIDVASEVFMNKKFLVFGLVFQTVIQIPVSTSNYSKVSFFQIGKFVEPFIQFLKSQLNRNSLINHFLCDSCQLCAEGSELRIKFRFHILMKSIQFFACRQMHNNNRELDDLGARLWLFILNTGSLEVQDQKILKLSLRFVCLHSKIINKELILFLLCIYISKDNYQNELRQMNVLLTFLK